MLVNSDWQGLQALKKGDIYNMLMKTSLWFRYYKGVCHDCKLVARSHLAEIELTARSMTCQGEANRLVGNMTALK
jgi:hypothetical protein